MTNKIIKKLKENDQDFEWYSTTNKIIECLYKDIQELESKYHSKYFSLLDIGAGNGKIFDVIRDLSNKDKNENKNKINEEYAIEKSKILIEAMNNDIFIIGTDFKEQTLIDKKVDLIFCNPPYKEYSQWTEKIIKEANCKYIYLVIPERWKNQENIKDALKKRQVEYKIIGSFDFLDSEDRQARAKVDLIKIDLTFNERYAERCKTDPFNIWFEDNFKINAEKKETFIYESDKKEILKNLITKDNLIDELEKLYQKDMKTLMNNYKAIESLNFELLNELNVNIDNLKKSLKLKIENIKSLYWNELFDNLNTITNRLTSQSRKKMLKKLIENTSIDFTANNAYSVIIWCIKNANKYFDKQLIEIYMNIAKKENIINYKSNKRIETDKWRYIEGKVTHYKLDYRLICSHYEAILNNQYTRGNNLSHSANTIIEDIFTIANNLGFINITSLKEVDRWFAGEKKEFYYMKENEKELFAEIKAYKNGNLHFKFNQEFMKKFNIEAARLNGWIKNVKEAAYELDIDIKEIEDNFNSNFCLTTKNMPLLIRN